MGQSVIKNPRKIFSQAGGSGSGTLQSIIGGTDITIDNTDPANPIINYSGVPSASITVVSNYSALPAANTVSGDFYWVSNSQGTKWLPGSLGGTYYTNGLYYSNGTTWEYIDVPYQATQAEVNTGTNDDKFVTPNTFTNASKWGTKADRQDEVLSGGTITIGDYDAGGTNNDVRVSTTSWYLASTQTVYSTLTNTDFYNIALSTAGLQRFVAFYGDNTSTITKVEGVEDEYAVMPSTPANSVLIGYILVTDGSLGVAPDLSAYATINPRVRVVASELIPTLNVDTHDELYITALAGNITSMSTNLTGALANGRVLVFKIKDNGVTRSITWGAKFTNKYVTLPTSTTANKELLILVKYNSATALLEAFAWIEQP
jgi:hypothetical protein